MIDDNISHASSSIYTTASTTGAAPLTKGVCVDQYVTIEPRTMAKMTSDEPSVDDVVSIEVWDIPPGVDDECESVTSKCSSSSSSIYGYAIPRMMLQDTMEDTGSTSTSLYPFQCTDGGSTLVIPEYKDQMSISSAESRNYRMDTDTISECFADDDSKQAEQPLRDDDIPIASISLESYDVRVRSYNDEYGTKWHDSAMDPTSTSSTSSTPSPAFESTISAQKQSDLTNRKCLYIAGGLLLLLLVLVIVALAVTLAVTLLSGKDN